MSRAEPVTTTHDDPFQALLEQTMAGNLDVDLSRDLEPGEKADDAIDFENISDTELAADDGDMVQGQTEEAARHDSKNSRPAGPNNRDNPDDLFEDQASRYLHVDLSEHDVFGERVARLFRSTDKPGLSPQHEANINEMSREEQLQRELFARSHASVIADINLPEPPENTEQLLRALWPKYQKDAVPRFMELLPPNKARFLARVIPKPPRNLNPTKLSLNFGPDQDKLFKTSAESHKRLWDDTSQPGLVPILSKSSVKRRYEHVSDEEGDEEEIAEADEERGESGADEAVAAAYNEVGTASVSRLDLQILCEDWTLSSDSDAEGIVRNADFAQTDLSHSGFQKATAYTLEDYSKRDLSRRVEEPERTIAHISKKVKLDFNDHRLLLHCHPPKLLLSTRDDPGIASASLKRRYNISNDDEYDLLKENHQNKIRGILGNLQLDHAMPALRLQWPFYPTRLEKQQARSFHRPFLKISRQEQISFTKPSSTRRKHLKGKDAHDLFAHSSNLSLADNSNALLLEYSEEHPMILSNLGMANRIINHYRKKYTEDPNRPKMDIGELNPLLPNDKSPFNLFGFVDSGHVVSAVQNAMYQAPIFKHDPLKTDFLITKTTTGINGPHWYLRNVENLYVVGQEFPLVEVPGSNSRKVSTAAKNRLKMIAYRLARRSKHNRISVSAVTKHFPDTTDMQNRQKMKDFMQFDKLEKEWKPKPGESVPDEDAIRSMVKPEEICLLESMQSGEQHLLDAGVVKLGEEIGAANDTQDNDHIETKLAPWFASKHFLQSTQGKAMLQLHGEGDPTGRGEAISMVKTSMKGGFKSQGSSASERMEDKKDKEKGHTYNVQRQTQAYEESIRRIWDAQKQSLATNIGQSDSDFSDEDTEEPEVNSSNTTSRIASRATALLGRRLDDETASQSSRWSNTSQSGKMLEITRTFRGSTGAPETVRDVIRNPRIIRQYIRRRNALQAGIEDVAEMKAGSDEAENKRIAQKLQMELARLNRNKDRRIARDKQKGIFMDGIVDPDGSPVSPSAAQSKAGATQRKCANCGQIGHIKTNKKLCPLLNGKMNPEDGFSSNAFTSGAPAL